MSSGPRRCAAHPSRPALDDCPRCARPRCGADAAALGSGCGVCGPTRGRPEPAVVRWIRAALGVSVAVPVLGAVGSQYVDSSGYALLLPALAGVAVAEVARRAAGAGQQVGAATARGLRLLAAGGAVLAAAAAFSFAPGRVDLLTPPGRVLPPYLLAAAAAVAWSPRARRSSVSWGGVTGR